MLIERPPRIFRILHRRGIFRIPEKSHGNVVTDPMGCADAGISKGKGTVYLTFDDGPIPEVTPWVLDLLDSHGIKATFFMVGDNVRRNPGLLEEVRRRGHVIGNHTMHHVKAMEHTARGYLKDVEEADVLLQTRLFRPPHGWLWWHLSKALGRKYKTVMYDLVTRDYSWRLTPDEVFENVKRYVRPGSIIVFHDSLKSWPRLQSALPRALEWLRQEGYTFGVIDPDRI